ncbi:MAG: hypothetical protein ACP5UF_06835 [Hydrogenobaculum sp.]
MYKVPYKLQQAIEDDSKNILIVPEVLDGLMQLKNYKKIRKGVWFLSVDNYYLTRLTKKDFLTRAVNKLSKKLFGFPVLDFDITSQRVLDELVKKYDYRKDDLLKLADFYMTNSFRGLEWFKGLEPLYYLSEYLNPNFLSINTELSRKINIVAFNPKKGTYFTEKNNLFNKRYKICTHS